MKIIRIRIPASNAEKNSNDIRDQAKNFFAQNNAGELGGKNTRIKPNMVRMLFMKSDAHTVIESFIHTETKGESIVATIATFSTDFGKIENA